MTNEDRLVAIELLFIWAGSSILMLRWLARYEAWWRRRRR